MTTISPVSGSAETCKKLVKLIKQCTSFSWASAWCTDNPVFNTALEHKAKIAQLVIGTTHYFTAASCLDELKDLPPARVFAPNATPMFHPKVYAFDLGKELCVYVGSANLTGAGMARNIEAGVFLQGDRNAPELLSFVAFIRSEWARAEKIDGDFIRSYRANQERAGDALEELESFTRIKKAVVNNAFANDIDPNDMDWALFIKRVEADRAHGLSTRLEVLSQARQLLSGTSSFAGLPEIDQRRICGLLSPSTLDGLDWGFFGQMTSHGRFSPTLQNHAEAISHALDRIPLTGAVKRRHYDAFVANFLMIPGSAITWIGFATRLLAMKRPDYFFCYCDPNKRPLANAFGTAYSTVTLRNYWERFIAPMQLMPWWQQELPGPEYEQQLWLGRAALLDAIFYDPAVRIRSSN